MEVQIAVPPGTDMSVIWANYPDMEPEAGGEDCDRYWAGCSDEALEDGDQEWFTREEAIECCGFVEGAIPGAETLIEGNGQWAQCMLRRRDFSGITACEETLASRKQRSDQWWAAFERGVLAAADGANGGPQ